MPIGAALALSLATLAAPVVGPGECVVVAPLHGAATVFGGEECSRRTLPASTFKVPHALIGLQTGVITDKTVYQWDGTNKDFPSWNRDFTLEPAIRNSVVWFFQRMATAIGRDRELESLRAFQYGSATFAHHVTAFWLNGDLQISPLEQVAFLKKMFADELPVERRHVDTVKAAMIMPPGKYQNAMGVHDLALRWPAGTIVRVKTGSGAVNGERSLWLVGALETGGQSYVFASRVRQPGTPSANAAADLAVRVLNAPAFAPAALRRGDQAGQMPAPGRTLRLVELWAQGKPAFGVYAPNERPGPRGPAASAAWRRRWAATAPARKRARRRCWPKPGARSSPT